MQNWEEPEFALFSGQVTLKKAEGWSYENSKALSTLMETTVETCIICFPVSRFLTSNHQVTFTQSTVTYTGNTNITFVCDGTYTWSLYFILPTLGIMEGKCHIPSTLKHMIKYQLKGKISSTPFFLQSHNRVFTILGLLGLLNERK